MTSLGRAAVSGALVTIAAQGTKIGIQLASVVVLSRLLSPHDYGLLAIVLVVIGFGEIFRDFGLTSASVQAPSLSRGQRDNLFWINLAIGIVLGALMFGVAWPLSTVMGEPDLLPIAQVLAVTFVLNGATTQYRAQLLRGLKFTAIAFVEVIAAALALAVAIIAALAGAGYWALVLQQVATAALLLIGAFSVGRWVPRLYSRLHSVAGIVRFGWKLVATNLLSYAGSQIDTVLVAARLGTVPLGSYNRAYQLVMTPVAQVRSPISSVAIPVLSRVQEDAQRFDAFIVSGQLALGYGLGIPLLFVAGLADPLAQILLGPQWGATVPLIRLFALATLLTTLAFVGYWVYVSRGLGSQLFMYSMVSLVIRVSCIGVGSFFGLIGIAVGVVAAPALAWPISIYWLSRITPVPAARLYAGAVRVLCAASVAGSTAWAVGSLVSGSWGALGAGVGAGLLATTLLLVLPVYRRDARSLWGFVTLLVRRRT